MSLPIWIAIAFVIALPIVIGIATATPMAIQIGRLIPHSLQD